MGLRLDILNINFRGARKTLNKTPRGRFLTPRRVARVPTTPAATNHVKTCNDGQPEEGRLQPVAAPRCSGGRRA